MNMMEENDIEGLDEVAYDVDLGDIGESLNSGQGNYRSLGPGSSPLCRFLSERDTQDCVESGYVGSTNYVIPLHQISIVPGHTMSCIGICSTGSTRIGQEVDIQCHLNGAAIRKALSGSVTLSSIQLEVHSSMEHNDILPPLFNPKGASSPQTNVEIMDMAPITLGCEDNVTMLRGLEIKVCGNRGQYIVPLDCHAERYKVPCGLGSIFVVNNVVLMYPNVPKYLVEDDQRKPTEEQLGFLCCTSSSSSAALKGLIRYTVCDVVCRCYNCGVGDQIVQLSHMLGAKRCICEGMLHKEVIVLAGTKVTMCKDCVHDIETAVCTFSSKTPHSLTIHKSPVKYNGMDAKVLSFSTGTVMRWMESQFRWVDSKTDIQFEATYRNLCVTHPIY